MSDNPDAPVNPSAPAVARLAMITLDATEPGPLAAFWSAVLAWPIVHQDEHYAMLAGPSHALGIGAVPDAQVAGWPDEGRKQFHLDLAADDVEAAAARCVELGATRPTEQPGDSWVVLVDPAGHPFCVTNAANWG